MPSDALGADTVTFIRRELAGTDRHGSDVYVDHEMDIAGCSMQPMWGQEVVGNLDQVIDRWRLFLPALNVTWFRVGPTKADRLTSSPHGRWASKRKPRY